MTAFRRPLAACTVAAFMVVLACPLASAFACPDLNGVFACPASAGQPATVMTAKTRMIGGNGAQYSFAYRIMGRDMPFAYEVAPDSLRKPGDTNSCEGNVVVHKGATETVRLSLDEQGNLKREENGKAAVCARKSE
jgi:hypothetical protein